MEVIHQWPERQQQFQQSDGDKCLIDLHSKKNCQRGSSGREYEFKLSREILIQTELKKQCITSETKYAQKEVFLMRKKNMFVCC